ncbi:MAG TPA: insulinase family protein [Kofleriaceae bacterium]|jgi:zinc protease|nr:insulinase family protein [Kofleriaceae bacterium]
MKRAFLFLISLLVLVLVAACGPKPAPTPVPTLPGDGDANVAKPTESKNPVTADAWSGRTDLIAPPAPKPPAAVELPAIDSYKLANGLQVFVIKSDRLPVMSMQLAVRAGRMHEPRARLGVSELTADMLVKGTKRRDALALAKAIDFVGGTIAADATYEATLVSCSVLARNAKTCFELLPEMITQPNFPESELVKVREQEIARVRNRLDDAGALASAHVQNLLWGNDHVRGWIDSESSIAAIKREDLVAWHRAWFVPANAMLVVTGDVDPKKLKGDLERSFGAWAKGPVPPSPQYKEPGLSGSKIRLVDKPGQTQTHIRVAQFGIKHEDPRFFDSLVWNYTLGGGAFSSRLMRVVRVEGGKTYGASSAFDRNLDKGSFVVTTFTRNAEAVPTTKLLLGEIAKMAQEGPTQAEVDAAIANIAGSYGLRFQTAAEAGAALIAAELHGFGREYLANYPLAVGKVDVASAKRAAHEILDPKDYVVVMVGDAKDLEPQLQKAGWRYEKVAFTDPVSPEAPKQEVVVDAKAAEAAKKLVDEAIAAKGGKAKLAGIKAFKMLAVGETTMGPQTVKVETERLFVLPDKMRIDATLVGLGKVVIGVNGKTGWQLAPNPQTGKPAVVTIGAQDFKQIEFERWREPELLLLKAADPNAKLRPAPDETINGKPNAVVKIASPLPNVEVAIYIDKATKLVTRTSYIDAASATTETDEFADYKAVSGIKIAHKRTSTSTGQGARKTKLELKSVEIDPKIDPKVFETPATP